MIARVSVIVGFMLLIGSCGPNRGNTNTGEGKSGSGGSSSGTGSGGGGVIKDCPDATELTDFLQKTGKTTATSLTTIANELKASKQKYTPNQLKNFGGPGGDPIGQANLHCTPGTELMKFSDEKCRLNGQVEDIKKIKTQCVSLGKIVAATPPASVAGKDWTTLSAAEKTTCDAYIKLIIDGFAE